MGSRLGSVLVATTILIAGCPGPAPVPPTPDGGPLDGGPPGCRLDGECDDGDFCTGVEMCQPASPMADGRGCVDAPAPRCMPTQTCDEAMDACLSDCDIEPDADGDGADSMACGGLDCDDADPLRAPGRTEVCDAEDRDEDCDASTFGDRDRDRDTFVDAACCNEAAAGGGARTCGTDCDDDSVAVSPLATEVCDGRDNDCDAASDEGVLVSGFADEDGDLHGDPAAALDACPGASRFSLLDDDCDDTNNRVHGAQVEVCDSLDNDCNGVVDDRTRPVTWYRDADGDGFGSASGGTRIACDPPAGYELLPIDCDDMRAGTSPIADEACNGRDDDCDGRADYQIGPGDFEDDDADGFVDVSCGGLGDDCDDGDEGVYPGADPYCDGRDHDCDGMADVGAPVAWYRDEDGDGWGAGTAMMSCDPPTGYVRHDGDCDDSLPRRSPSEPDECNAIDDDCDAAVDEDATRVAFYADMDGDGAGGGTPLLSCVQPAGYGLYPTDCDDTTTSRYEGALETCDGVDNDCDGMPDDAADVVCGLPGATGSCVAGSCVVSGCLVGFADCDGTGATGCEIDTRTDPLHCGGCPTACPAYPASTPSCVASTCGISCNPGALDCDGVAATGCEAGTTTDPFNCGMCGRRCAPRAHAPATCVAGACDVACDPGWTDCDGNIVTGCEVNTAADPTNCGGCRTACPLTADACIRGDCLPVPFGSDGTVALDVTTDLVLSPGIHEYTTIYVHAGARVTTNGTGVLELRASGDVIIEGVVDVSGGRGGTSTTDPAAPYEGHNGGGGATGDPLGIGADGTNGCNPGGGGGEGGVGGAGNTCPSGGGAFGGGAGAGIAADVSGNALTATGSGGGGFAGGGGGFITPTLGGVGASLVGVSVGGSGLCGGGEPSAGVYAGATCSMSFPGGGGGGSIGEPAASDLAVAATFRPGSGGGGGRNSYFGPPTGGGGGGGGGGVIRITSLTRITISATGAVRADGGAGGGTATGDAGGGGGGSGGVVYLAAPQLDIRGTVSAAGGRGNPQRYPGANGGLGRIRLSVLPEYCTLFGTFTPGLVSAACTSTRTAPVPGRVYIDEYPF